MSKVMALRFQPATQAEQQQKPMEGQARLAAEPTAEQLEAVKRKQFGRLTRNVVEWHPHRMLCKRFGVADPYPDVCR